MSGYWHAQKIARALLAEERGTIRKDAPHRVAMVYPSPYRAAMSSLGYQQIYRGLNEHPDIAADRAVLPDDVATFRAANAPLITLEREEPVGNYPVLAFSVAYELELAGLIDCLDLAGIPPLRADRTAAHPLVVAGGPLTFSNPAPLAPFCDAIALGEGEELALDLVTTSPEDLASRPGFYVPEVHGDRVPPVAKASDHLLPARSQILTPNTELRSMFLTEAARGCSRGCTYCVMRRSTNGGMRIVPMERILAGIPEHATRVGLVGAAVTDHPKIVDIVAAIVESGREIGISSLRADRLTSDLVRLLEAGGYKTLTVAADGASQRLRDLIERKHSENQLLDAARLAKQYSLRTLKVYMMVGVPSETDEDIDELIRFAGELHAIHGRIAFGVAPFVAKRNTPLDGTEFAGIKTIERRLARLRKGLKGTAVVRPTSARWAWVEYMLAQGGPEAGLAVLDAHRAGGTFADYKRAFEERGIEPTGPVARVPTTPELMQLRRAQR